MNKLVNLTLLALYCILIYWLSSRPSLNVPMLFTHHDKIHHMFAYFIMGLLAYRFFGAFFAKPSSCYIVSLCFCSLYGLSDEWHQSFVQGRDGDLFDWLADTLGALIALGTIQLTKKKQKTEILAD